MLIWTLERKSYTWHDALRSAGMNIWDMVVAAAVLVTGGWILWFLEVAGS